MRFHEFEGRLYRRLRAERVVESRAEARTLLEALLEILSGEILAGKRVRLTGLGTFVLTRAAPRRAYDFREGRPLELPSRTRVLFRASRRLKEALSGK